MKKYSTGADKSKIELSTFVYEADKANYKGGKRYDAKDIEDQSRVGICTSISLTQQARKATGVKYSADFQYLLQKKYFDMDWTEGSSIFHALKAASKYGLLPEKYFKYKIKRNQSYTKYIEQLKAIPEKDIQKLLKKCVKIKGYQSVPVSRNHLANAIDESEAGILARFALGSEWWTAPIEPVRPPKFVISGHAVTECNYTGNSFRIANSWGDDWADKGTAYHLTNYMPSEAWLVHYNTTSAVLDKQLEQKDKTIGIISNLVKRLISLF